MITAEIKVLAYKVKNKLSAFSGIIFLVLILWTLLCCFLMLESSAQQQLSRLMISMEADIIVLNLLTIGILLAFFLILCNRVWLSCLLCAAACGMIAMVNHVVLLYHNMPLSFLVVKNFTTAMNMVSSYHFSVDRTICLVAVLFLFTAVMCVLIGILVEHKRIMGRNLYFRNTLLIILSILVLHFGYWGENPIKPHKTIGWLWSEAYHQYGFAACTIESIYQSQNPVLIPEGYSEKTVESINIAASAGGDARPDIILILNETFYDLRQIIDFTTDVPYLENINHLENALTGYAVVPSAGGGTNNAEYELLTSNSMWLFPGITPFNVLDLYGANNIASYMNQLGYHTTGSHSEPAVNYSRVFAYNALGFQQTHFDEDFLDQEYFHTRWYETDQCLYRNLIRWYEESPKEKPRFQYLLTIQNHGPWDFLEDKQNIVHVQEDFGEYTAQMNELLTGMYLSDQAFAELTDYFSAVQRPVILCMVGDHGPSFVSQIVDQSLSQQEKNLRMRKVPLIIWANFELEEVELGTMGLNCVVPTLLEIAGMPLGPYYRYLLQVKELVPIITAYGDYYDFRGTAYHYKQTDSPYKKFLDDYFCLEYYSIRSPNHQSIFYETASR